MADEQWDAIIAGCGLAGLSLAYALSCERKDSFRILLIDQEKRKGRDHTWCFWEKGDGVWDNQLSWEWSEIQVGLGGALKQYPLNEYKYKYLESDLFYEEVWNRLEGDPRFEFREVKITDVSQVKGMGVVQSAEGACYQAAQVFSSIPDAEQTIEFWQHFMGWEVHSTKPVFEPSKATLMDFQPDEAGEVRFLYLLPVSETEALVEYTVFGPHVWAEEAYFEKLADYLRTELQIAEWAVKHEEIGAIPMSMGLEKKATRPIRYIGTAGGGVKPSTGYAFSRVQRDSQNIARAWKVGKSPPRMETKRLYRSCDATLLNLMQAGEFSTSAYFASLFERWGGDKMLGFLDEQLPLSEVLGIMNKSPWGTFIPAWIQANLKS